MNLRGLRDRDDPEINFIPLIDVLLVILIFLMVTTTYQRVAELQITLPEADADAAKQRPKEVNVGIDAQGRYVIDKNVFTFTNVGALGEMLRKGRGRHQGSGGHHQRRCQRDASVGHPRDGGRAPGRPRPHHVRDADAGEVARVGAN
jgi:biopolymer transport protein ExbD